MAVQYGMRTKDAAGRVTLDTSITSIRSLKMMTITGNGQYNQTLDVPEITAESFVVVDALMDLKENTWTPQAWWTPGQLQLRAAGVTQWQLMILSQGNEPFANNGDYGVRTFNNNVKTQIDSVNRVLGIRYSGEFEFGVYWRPGMQAQIIPSFFYKFPTPITTYERPMIFLNAANYMMVGGFYVEGSPGNWTGWGIVQYGNYHAHHGLAVSDYMQMKWYCATYQSDTSVTGVYGATVRAADGSRLFSSTANIATLNSQPTATPFYNDGQPIELPGNYISSFRMPWTGQQGDYVLANALFSCTNIVQGSQPIKTNFGGFLPNDRTVLKMHTSNAGGVDAVTPNGRTAFASRPQLPL
ncbi:hypothetical protein EI533_26560 [Pseudomonas donghuensis]|nr:hypothetical protein [Pseudomonas donghuensis]